MAEEPIKSVTISNENRNSVDINGLVDFSYAGYKYGEDIPNKECDFYLDLSDKECAETIGNESVGQVGIAEVLGYDCALVESCASDASYEAGDWEDYASPPAEFVTFQLIAEGNQKVYVLTLADGEGEQIDQFLRDNSNLHLNLSVLNNDGTLTDSWSDDWSFNSPSEIKIHTGYTLDSESGQQPTYDNGCLVQIEDHETMGR